ncbi:hypothetical protein Hanom_Chr16g01460461 [Helianthus anomalus]
MICNTRTLNLLRQIQELNRRSSTFVIYQLQQRSFYKSSQVIKSSNHRSKSSQGKSEQPKSS